MKHTLLLLFFFCYSLIIFSQEITPYKNPGLPVDERVNDLISRMTLDEKVSQMVYTSPAIDRLGIPAYNWWNEALHGVARNGIATVFPQAIGLAAAWDTSLIYKISTLISDEARAKYNKVLKKRNSRIYEGLTFWSPNINIFRDPRWGRGMETYGEDPFLTGELGVQFIKGLQGNDPKYLKTVATPKHFAVHSGPEPERHEFNAVVSDYDLRETYLPHFKKAIMRGNAYSVMCAYNRLQGMACCGSDPLLGRILRDEWGFKGYVVSDCWAVSDISGGHKLTGTLQEASALAVKSGTDLECGNSYPLLVEGVKKGLITEEQINVSLKRLLTARFKLGMFDPPGIVPFSGLMAYNTDKGRELALEAARKSIVLLKNENNQLPLSRNIKTLAVIGPNANDAEVLLGNYNGIPSAPVTPLQGIKNKLGGAEVLYEQGCEVADGMPSFEGIGTSFLYTSEDKKENGLRGEYFNNSNFSGAPAVVKTDKLIDFNWGDSAPDSGFSSEDFSVRWTGVLVPQKSGEYKLGGYGFSGFRIFLDDTLLCSFEGEHESVKSYKTVSLTAGKSYRIKIELFKTIRYSFIRLIWSVPDENHLARALEAAKKADAVIMMMGLSPRLEGEEMKVDIKGFKGGDRLTLDLPESQQKLIKMIHALRKPVVLVLLNGSAVSVNWENENIPAIIEAWYPGQEAGTAIADVIFGDYNPSGRLPVTFYKSAEQLPAFTDYNMDGRTYRYFKDTPLYPFGYGLSYTTFSYKNVKPEKSELNRGEQTIISFEVANTGKVKGEETAQLYIKAADDTKALKTLKGFMKLTLNPGETKCGEFRISSEELSRWIDGKGYSAEPGKYIIWVGSSSAEKDLHKTELTVLSR